MKQKSNLLNSIAQYCYDNNLTIWSESKSGYSNLLDLCFFIGTNNNFLEYQKNSEHSYNKIKKNNNIFYEKQKISFYHNWKNIKEKSELAVDVFWDTSSLDTKSFFSSLFCEIDLSVCLNYKNQNFPSGFDSGMLYSTGKNWRNFLECFSREQISLSFNDNESINNYFNVVNGFDNYIWHGCLNYLISTAILSEESQINISYKLKNLFKNEKTILDTYAKKITFLQELITEDFNSSLFSQEEIYHLEKIELKRNDIMAYFYSYKVSEEKLIKLTKDIFILFKTNVELKKLGLEKIELIEQPTIYDNFSCLLNFSKNKEVDKKTIILIYKNCMNVLLQNKEVVFNSINSTENIKNVTNSTILKEIIEIKLPIKQHTEHTKLTKI